MLARIHVNINIIANKLRTGMPTIKIIRRLPQIGASRTVFGPKQKPIMNEKSSIMFNVGFTLLVNSSELFPLSPNGCNTSASFDTSSMLLVPSIFWKAPSIMRLSQKLSKAFSHMGGILMPVAVIIVVYTKANISWDGISRQRGKGIH